MSAASLRAAALALAAATATLAGASGALAWDSPEHEEMGLIAFQAACMQHQNLPMCNKNTGANFLLFGRHSRVSREATAQADYCHSIYFTDIGIEINGTDSERRAGCRIIGGVPYSDTGPYTSFGVNKYLMFTNKQHFGDHIRPHAALYFNLALTAAARYRTKPNPSAAANRCSYTAIALAGFANHYVTDRTASGHAWTPAGHGFAWGTTPAYTVGMVGCFHDQVETYKRGVISQTTGFSCVDSGWFGERVYVGLGSTGRWFAAPHYNDEHTWWSDYQWKDNVRPIATGSGMQRAETISAARSLVDAVLTAMEGGVGASNYGDTFVSSFEMCKVAWGQCCRAFDATTTCGSWDDPNIRITPTCDYCNPDITHAKLLEKCPYKRIRRTRVNNGGVWKSVYGASVWHDYYAGSPIRSDPDWRGDYGYDVELDVPAGGWAGANAARQLAATEVGTIHPDAQWDRDNDVVALLGCPQ